MGIIFIERKDTMFIARQPIFNRDLDVYGYELLYRDSNIASFFNSNSHTSATASVLCGLFESGIKKIVENKKAFVNFNKELLHMEILEIIDTESLVLEVLESVEPDAKLYARIRDLKERGYKIALDDFEKDSEEYPLMDLANIVKFDIIATPLDTISNEVRQALRQKKVILAEKVESLEEFNKAFKMGFHLFQGYFFSKPNIISENLNKSTTKTQYMRIMNELSKKNPSYQILAEIIEKDVNLAYRLMYVVNSRSKDDLIYSIKRALTYMGLKEISLWINILMLREFGNDKPDELLRMSLLRTKFIETIALKSKFKNMKYEAAMVGLFSTIDALLDQDMSKSLSDIALPDSVKDALIRHEGPLFPIYKLALVYERGLWPIAKALADDIGISEDSLDEDYRHSVEWADNILSKI